MTLSFIIPTDNESQNILELLEKIHDRVKPGSNMEVVVDVNDNSSEGTRRAVEGYAACIGTQGGRRLLPFRYPF
jgi:glycosyltransferase involved in cell wall biosynthesis